MTAEQIRHDLTNIVSLKAKQEFEENIARGLKPYQAAHVTMDGTREYFTNFLEFALGFVCYQMADQVNSSASLTNPHAAGKCRRPKDRTESSNGNGDTSCGTANFTVTCASPAIMAELLKSWGR